MTSLWMVDRRIETLPMLGQKFASAQVFSQVVVVLEHIVDRKVVRKVQIFGEFVDSCQKSSLVLVFGRARLPGLQT